VDGQPDGSPPAEWLPLARAALSFSIQQVCERATAGAEFSFEYDPTEGFFSVRRELKDEWDGKLASDNPGVFWIGDDRPTMFFDLEREGPFIETVADRMRTFHALLEGLLSSRLETERLGVWARKGRLSEQLVFIPPDVFRYFKITDWKNGTAKAEGEPALKSIHIGELPTTSAPTGRRQETELADLFCPIPISDDLRGESLPQTLDKATIHAALLKVHHLAKEQGTASPNTNNIARYVNHLLARDGMSAKPTLIRLLAADRRYDDFELKQGESAQSRGLRRFSDLQI
jgi:hypothetical protein